MTDIDKDKADSFLQLIWKTKAVKLIFICIFTMLLFFVSTITIKAIMGHPAKMLWFEVNSKSKPDTFYIFIHDTQRLLKTDTLIITKYSQPKSGAPKTVDTSKSKYNLSGPFNGPTQIGENNTQNNYGKLDRHLNEQDKANLLKRLNTVLADNKIPKNTMIDVMHPIGEEEAFNFALEVANFLDSQGYNVRERISQSAGALQQGFWIEFLQGRIIMDVGGSKKP